MKRIVYYIGLLLLLTATVHCSRFAALRQARLEQHLKERVLSFNDAFGTGNCRVLLPMLDRFSREYLSAEFRQAFCEPIDELHGSTFSLQKIIISDDQQAAIVEFGAENAVKDLQPHDGIQRWLRENGDWYVVPQNSDTLRTFIEHFSTSKNFDPKHPAFRY